MGAEGAEGTKVQWDKVLRIPLMSTGWPRRKTWE
jgi:hypothetical protein